MPPVLLVALLVLLATLASLISIFHGRASHKNGRKLPPGPRALPIIGNLHMLGAFPHRNLYNLAKKYGDIMSIRLGYVQAIVVSSPQAAELFLKTHDTTFASRPIVQASKYMSYGAKAIVFGPYSPYWRNIRKVCTLQLLSASKVEYFAPMRREEVGLVVESIKKSARKREVVDLSLKIGNLMQDMTYRMVFGQGDFDELDLKPLIKEALFLSGSFNVSDYVPFLAPLDLQGLAKRMKAVSKTMDKVLEKIVSDHEKEARWLKQQQMDFIDFLLSLMNQPNDPHDESMGVIDRTNIKAIIMDMVVAAFDTSALTVEWTLAELLRHPTTMKRLQDELHNVVGMNRMVEESDLPKLTYMDMVIKEALRLHPTAPILVPHESMEDLTVNGYYIPKKSQVLVNTWAIQRDTNAWSHNADDFLPERFENSSIDLRGRDFQLIPFGSGRRGCPGLNLGLTIVRFVLAQLVHCFNWELPAGMLPTDVDMTEKFSLALERASHLLAVPTYRLHC